MTDSPISNPPVSPEMPPNQVRTATESGRIPAYDIRKCRGHWHVTVGSGENGDDLIVKGDPFSSAEEAQAIADKRNAGIPWEEIESRSSQPSSSSEITEAILELESCAQILGSVGYRWANDQDVPTSDMEEAQKEMSAARIRLESLYLEQRREISDLRERLTSWEEDEARVCPEDFGMEEYIPILEKRVREQLQEIERREEALEMFREGQARDKAEIERLRNLVPLDQRIVT